MEQNAALKRNAQNLRKNQTKEESLLWNLFLKKYPLRFRRQYVIGNYIVDFYCHGAKLAVELDGSQHFEPTEQEKDQIRTTIWSPRGFRSCGSIIWMFCGDSRMYVRRSTIPQK